MSADEAPCWRSATVQRPARRTGRRPTAEKVATADGGEKRPWQRGAPKDRRSRRPGTCASISHREGSRLVSLALASLHSTDLPLSRRQGAHLGLQPPSSTQSSADCASRGTSKGRKMLSHTPTALQLALGPLRTTKAASVGSSGRQLRCVPLADPTLNAAFWPEVYSGKAQDKHLATLYVTHWLSTWCDGATSLPHPARLSRRRMVS